MASLDAVQQIPGLDTALRWFLSEFSVKALRKHVETTGTRVTPKAHPTLHAAYREALDILDAPEEWPLYIIDSPKFNAAACGAEDFFIMITTGAIERLDEEELLVILGHEISHILSQHVLYKNLIRFMAFASWMAIRVPLAGLAWIALNAALREWDRKTELSADRAGLLTAQSPDAVQRTLMSVFAKDENAMSVEDFRIKMAEQEKIKDWKELMTRAFAFMNSTHPQLHERSREIDDWSQSEQYAEILSGTYIRRSGGILTDLEFEARQTAEEEMAEFDVDWNEPDNALVTSRRAIQSAHEDLSKKASRTFINVRRWLNDDD